MPFKNFEDTNRQFLFEDDPQNDWEGDLEKAMDKGRKLDEEWKNPRGGLMPRPRIWANKE